MLGFLAVAGSIVGAVGGAAKAVVKSVSGAKFAVGGAQVDYRNTDAKPAVSKGAISFATDWPDTLFGLPTWLVVVAALAAVVVLGRAMR